MGVETPSLDGIADAGGKYNITDVIDPALPMRRFLVAGLEDNAALIGIDRGGRGWGVEVTLFSNIIQTPKVDRKWILLEEPRTLRALVDLLAAQQRKPPPWESPH